MGKIQALSKIIQTALAHRPMIWASSNNVDMKSLIAATSEQFLSIFEAHSEGECCFMPLAWWLTLIEDDPVMLRILNYLRDINDKIALFPNLITNASILNNCQLVVTALDGIQDIVSRMAKKIDDESLIFTMRTFTEAGTCFMTISKISFRLIA